MARDELKEFLVRLGTGANNPVLKSLMQITLKYRDELKWEQGETLTVHDVRVAVDAFLAALEGNEQERTLTANQSTLLRKWIDSVTEDGEQSK